MSIEIIRQLEEQRKEIDKLLESEVRSTFPVGSRAERKHGQFWILCEVTAHGYGTDVFLKNESSGKIVRRDATFEVIPA